MMEMLYVKLRISYFWDKSSFVVASKEKYTHPFVRKINVNIKNK